MKILFVTYRLSDGGAERVVSVLANQFYRIQGIEPSVFIYRRNENEYPLNEEIPVFTLDDSYSEEDGNSFSRAKNRIMCIRKIIELVKPDVILPFLDSMVMESFFAAKKSGTPVIATVRNLPKEKGIRKYLRDHIFAKCSAVYCQTEEQKKYFSPKIQRKTFVVGNPVPENYLSEMHEKRERIREIVTLGRLTEQKNHVVLIQAMEKVRREIRDVHLTIYGTGEEEEKIRRLLKEKHLEEVISLAGRTEDVGGVLKKADMFVLSSDYEGMPNALMEAMAAGLPCVSTDCPTGPKELLGENERGMLVPVNDSGELAKAILYMMEHPLEAYEKGRAARQYVEENYTAEKVAEYLEDELRKVLYV